MHCTGQMRDNGVIGKTPLNSKYPPHRCFVGGIRPKAIDGLRGIGFGDVVTDTLIATRDGQ